MPYEALFFSSWKRIVWTFIKQFQFKLVNLCKTKYLSLKMKQVVHKIFIWPYTWYVYWNAGFKLQAVHKVHVVEPVVRDVPDVRGLRDVRVSVSLDSLKIDQVVTIEW